MKVKNRKTPQRGFTLIEMLVVILIIAVLVALTAGVALKILGRGPELQRRSDISQLSDGVAQYKQVFKLTEPPPSRFALRSNILQYGPPLNTSADKLDIESVLLLKKMFSDRVGIDASGNVIRLKWNGIDIPDNQRIVLSGDQCLVFFLGGITTGSPPAAQGFSTNSRDPTRLDTDRIGPFYNFESNRLTQVNNNGFWSYNDPYGTPYAYFSSYKSTNGYNRYYSLSQTSDCFNQFNSNPVVWPYYSANGKYSNPTSFQIISAGKDTAFGCSTYNSTPWSPGNGSGGFDDDMSNFYDSVLGSK